jgi:thiol-disulfide isomerase/thioredoxin
MKKIFSFILIAIVFLSVFNFSLAQEQFDEPRSEKPVTLYFFYGETCPHCHKAAIFLEKLKEKYSELEIKSFEVFSNAENAKLLLQFLKEHGETQVVRVPAIFIGDEVIIGYLSDETTGRAIEKALEDNLSHEDQIIDYPFFGQVNLSRLSLPVLTVVVATLDGFNPCAMWVLLFLIALLINVSSRKRIWLVAGTFIAVSGVIYYLLLSAWLNLFLAIGYIRLTQVVIGLLALGVGLWQIRSFIRHRPGVCQVTPVGSKWYNRLANKAKRVVRSTALSATLVGVTALAIGVNLIEFFCSAGLPAIYTRILTLGQLAPTTYYLYLLLYTFIFMLDDLIVFGLAVITLRKIGFSEKYTKWSTLVGGLLILVIGLLLIFKPEFLIFG